MPEKKAKPWEEIERNPFVYPAEQYPFVSIVIPTQNCAESIPFTLESILAQEYPRYEVIVVDADSTDRTYEIIESYRNEKIHFFSVSAYHVNEMLNKGISLAKGQYIHFLFPGDFYLSPYSLQTAMGFSLNHLSPDLVFCASLIRRRNEDVRILFRPFDHHFLRQGSQPTSLEACWISMDTFRVLGKFPTDLTQRGAFAFFCRFLRQGNLRYASFYRVLNDYELRIMTQTMVYRHFVETMKVIFQYYGFWAATRWLFTQQDLGQFFRLWLYQVRLALFG